MPLVVIVCAVVAAAVIVPVAVQVMLADATKLPCMAMALDPANVPANEPAPDTNLRSRQTDDAPTVTVTAPEPLSI